jgi:hypothetical protein
VTSTPPLSDLSGLHLDSGRLGWDVRATNPHSRNRRRYGALVGRVDDEDAADHAYLTAEPERARPGRIDRKPQPR